MGDYLLGGNEAKWWTVGLSVMATQASAITFLSTPGQAYYDGMGFVQFYFALPIAMIVICITFIPIFYRLKVYTAYEYLESRFDLKTRTFTSFLFLIQRGLATGITIYAPAIVISSIMGWDLNVTAVGTGLIAILYTVSGGTRAVHVTHRIQMMIIFAGLVISFFFLLSYLPDDYSFNELMTIAGASGKLDIIDTEFNLDDRYNIWTCLLAAPFLFLSYFGTDQSQVQRYISGRSVTESRIGLLMNGFLKLPLQFFILFLGVLVFLFFQFNRAPIFFNEKVVDRVEASVYSDEAAVVTGDYDQLLERRSRTQTQLIGAIRSNDDELMVSSRLAIADIVKDEHNLRESYKGIITKVDSNVETNDKDYIFLNFIINHLPHGLIGLIFAMIFFAAMSTTASELNALASTTSVDIYKRLIRPQASEKHYLLASRLWTLFWGIVAILFAAYGTLFENLIQFVNIVGSIFYGTILGIFLTGFYLKNVKGHAVFLAAIITEGVVIAMYIGDAVSFLWLNLIGCLGVMILGMIIQKMINLSSHNS